MAILTKAALRTLIDSEFASTMKIPAEQAREQFHNWVDSLLAPASLVNGAGITVSDNGDGTVTVEAGGAAAAMGLPSFLANTNRDQPTDGTLVIDITGRTDPPPRPSIVYFQTPTVLNRAADPLALLLSGDTDTRRVILDQFGNGVFARNLAPGTWYTVLATPANRYEFAEPIPVRPQDFDVVCGWISTAEAGWTDEDIALANTATTDEVVIPDNRRLPAAADYGQSHDWRAPRWYPSGRAPGRRRNKGRAGSRAAFHRYRPARPDGQSAQLYYRVSGRAVPLVCLDRSCFRGVRW